MKLHKSLRTRLCVGTTTMLLSRFKEKKLWGFHVFDNQHISNRNFYFIENQSLTIYKECIADMNVSIGSFKTGKTFLSITTNDFIPPAPKLLQFAI